MKVSGKIVKEMARVYIAGLMGIGRKESGRITNFMEKPFCIIEMEKLKKLYTIWEK